jgi:streptogramin lyase
MPAHRLPILLYPLTASNMASASQGTSVRLQTSLNTIKCFTPILGRPGRRNAEPSSRLRQLLNSALAFFLILGILYLLGLLAGCGAGNEAIVSPIGAGPNPTGIVRAGLQPVTLSQVQVYAAGRAGNRSAATPLLATPIATDSNGLFNLKNTYTCAHSDDQLFLVATGGNPGLVPSVDNKALTLMAALGTCGQTPSYVQVDERSTAAAVWALAQFIGSATSVGSSSTNYDTGLTNAMLNAQLLTATPLPSNLTVEAGKLNALANALDSCADSNGGAACTSLFTAATPPGGTAPTDTLTAALNIVTHPVNQVAAVFQARPTPSPFATTLTHAPNEWTMSLTVTGGGLIEPTALDVDQQGNVWVADYPGYLSAFTPQGTPFRSFAYGNGILKNSFGLTIDTTGQIWVSNEEDPVRNINSRGAVSGFSGANSSSPGSFQNYIIDNTINVPLGLAADTNGNILVANASSSMASIYSNTGTLVTANLAQNVGSFTEAVTADASHGVWLANEGDGSAIHVDASGNVLSSTTCCAGADAIAVDVQGNAWVSDPYSGTVAEIDNSGNLLQLVNAGGVNSPSGLVIDAAQNVWVTNISGNSISELAGPLSSSPGAGLSPATGYGLDANLDNPHGIVVDASGNLWISNYSNNDVVMLFGLATPTATPVAPVALAP